MGELWRKVFFTLTRGMDLREALVKSSIMAVLCSLFTLPYFHYLVFVVTARVRFPYYYTSPWSFLFMQLFLLFIICFLSSLAGFFFSRRLDMPGMGDPKELIRSVPLLLCIGAVMITISYLFFDQYFYEISPFSYPKGILYLISLPFKGAFTEEIILRLCMVTLCIGFTRNRIAGIVLVSAMGAIFSIKYFRFMGIETGMNSLFITQLILSFASNIILGYLFVIKGLLYSMALKFIFSMKYILVALLLY